MLDEEIARAIVERRKPEQVMDELIESLATVEAMLKTPHPHYSSDYAAGCALMELRSAQAVLKELRNKQYGQKPLTVL